MRYAMEADNTYSTGIVLSTSTRRRHGRAVMVWYNVLQ